MTNPVRILLAEDNPADVYLIEEALRENQVRFELMSADDGEQAIAILEKNPENCPDLILLDLNMPKRGGAEVLTRIRQMEHCKKIPIIVLTSSDSPEDRDEALRLGATLYIRKPTDLDEFLSIGATIREMVVVSQAKENGR